MKNVDKQNLMLRPQNLAGLLPVCFEPLFPVVDGTQDSISQHGPQQSRAEPAEPSGDADGGGQPDSGGGGQAEDFFFIGEFEDRAATEKADAGDQSLQDATDRIVGHAF